MCMSCATSCACHVLRHVHVMCYVMCMSCGTCMLTYRTNFFQVVLLSASPDNNPLWLVHLIRRLHLQIHLPVIITHPFISHPSLHISHPLTSYLTPHAISHPSLHLTPPHFISHTPSLHISHLTPPHFISHTSHPLISYLTPHAPSLHISHLTPPHFISHISLHISHLTPLSLHISHLSHSISSHSTPHHSPHSDSLLHVNAYPVNRIAPVVCFPVCLRVSIQQPVQHLSIATQLYLFPPLVLLYHSQRPTCGCTYVWCSCLGLASEGNSYLSCSTMCTWH